MLGCKWRGDNDDSQCAAVEGIAIQLWYNKEPTLITITTSPPARTLALSSSSITKRWVSACAKEQTFKAISPHRTSCQKNKQNGHRKLIEIRYVVSFDCNFWSIKLSQNTFATTSKNKCKYLRSQWEIRTKTSKRSGARENVSDQQTVGFNFTSDRSKGWHEFTSQRSRKKLMTSQVAIVTPMKIAPKTEKTNFDPPRTSCKGGGGGGGENTYV